MKLKSGQKILRELQVEGEKKPENIKIHEQQTHRHKYMYRVRWFTHTHTHTHTRITSTQTETEWCTQFYIQKSRKLQQTDVVK